MSGYFVFEMNGAPYVDIHWEHGADLFSLEAVRTRKRMLEAKRQAPFPPSTDPVVVARLRAQHATEDARIAWYAEIIAKMEALITPGGQES